MIQLSDAWVISRPEQSGDREIAVRAIKLDARPVIGAGQAVALGLAWTWAAAPQMCT